MESIQPIADDDMPSFVPSPMRYGRTGESVATIVPLSAMAKSESENDGVNIRISAPHEELRDSTGSVAAAATVDRQPPAPAAPLPSAPAAAPPLPASLAP